MNIRHEFTGGVNCRLWPFCMKIAFSVWLDFLQVVPPTPENNTKVSASHLSLCFELIKVVPETIRELERRYKVVSLCFHIIVIIIT